MRYITLLLLLILFCGQSAAADTPSKSLPNPSFDAPSNATAIPGWAPYGSGYDLDPAVRHGHHHSIRCRNADTSATRGAICRCTIDQTEATPIIVTGWSKADGVSGSSDSDYSVYVDLVYTDGTPLWGQTAAFDTGSHDWQRRMIVISPLKPIRSIALYALFRNHSGTAWFADFDAHDVDESHVFDGQTQNAPVVSGSGGHWFVRDVLASSGIQPLTARTASRLGLTWQFTAAGSGVTVRNHTGRVRNLTIYYIEPFRGKNPVWWDDIRTSRSASGAREYSNLTSVNVGAVGAMSLYPFGCVTANGVGRAVGIPPSIGPRVVRIGYNGRAKVLYVAFDVALTAAGDAGRHDRALVEVVRYAIDPAWGFRSAAERYCHLFPEAFLRRTEASGIWIPFTDPSTVPNPADFGIAFHEGDNSVVKDRSLGILSFRYVEPMTYWMSMPPSTPRTYDAAMAQLKQEAAGDPSTDIGRSARSVMSSGTMDPKGKFNVAFRDTPWANGAVWVLNPNPAIEAHAGDWTKARQNALGEPVPERENEPDGEYLDSLESWADTLDYRPESLCASRVPLTFTTDDTSPVIPTWFSVYADTAALSDDVHRHGKLLMANSTPWRFAVFAPKLDLMGTETNWWPGGQWQPDDDAVFNLRRTLCYHKPYLLMQNTDFSKVGKDDIERYFRRCLFYGVFPSMFSADAATNVYWQQPRLYERDRPLFARYIPLIRLLDRAGWEPVTYARTDDPAVYIERFGANYFTLLNTSSTVRTVTVRFDAANPWGPSRKLGVADLLSGDKIGQLPEVSVTIPAGDVSVLSIQRE